MKKLSTRLKLQADPFNITLTIETVGQGQDYDVVVTFPRSSHGHKDAMESANDWRTMSKRKGDATGEKSSIDVIRELEALEIEET